MGKAAKHRIMSCFTNINWILLLHGNHQTRIAPIYVYVKHIPFRYHKYVKIDPRRLKHKNYSWFDSVAYMLYLLTWKHEMRPKANPAVMVFGYVQYTTQNYLICAKFAWASANYIRTTYRSLAICGARKWFLVRVVPLYLSRSHVVCLALPYGTGKLCVLI